MVRYLSVPGVASSLVNHDEASCISIVHWMIYLNHHSSETQQFESSMAGHGPG